MELIDQLYTMVSEAWGVPLGNEKCIVERDQVLEILDEIKTAMPVELSEAKRLVSARDEFINNAKREAEGIRNQAEERARALVNDQEIVRIAKARSNEMLASTQAKADALRQASSQFCVDALRRTEEAISAALGSVQQAHAAFQGVAGSTAAPAAPAAAPAARQPEIHFEDDAPLDMRMDQRNALSAYEVVNDYSEENLSRILHEYGEERFARKIAHNICVSRQQAPIRTTGELIEIIKRSIPAKIRATGGHPAKRTFQAIRIEVNQELTVLSESLDGMIDLLNDGGRLCVITFHSLEDRIVKNIFRKNEHPCTCPPEFPVCVCGKKSKGTVVTRKPILPGEEEMETNPRSKSAKLRVFERKV